MTATSGPDLRVAILSACGRFPGADSVEQLWQASLAGQVLLRRFERNDMLEDGVSPAELAAPNYVPIKGWLEHTDCFDARAFGYSPADAASIDPQQRIFLEECARAFDLAAVDPDRFDGRIGVFAGQFISTYFVRHLVPRLAANTDGIALAATFQGNTVDQLATRVAYCLNLRGPAVTVQTACSTSLVAVHMACSALLSGECDLALAGGVAVNFPSRSGYLHFEGGIHSRSGRCRPFDQHADGTVFGDGVGVVVLRRLSEAVAARDPIRAVILSTAVNNDGARKVSYSAPSVDGQKSVLSEALAMADVRPQDVCYLESHGTGTPVGDTVEIAAVKAVYGRDAGLPPLAIGALKANTGHLEAAAGVAGLIRTISVLEKGIIPPIAALDTVNPMLETDGLPIVFPKEATPWPRLAAPRRAAVSAFGVGGTNASVIVEQPPIAQRHPPASKIPRLVPISGASKPATHAAARAVAAASAKEEANLADIQRALAVGRPQLPWRCAAIAATNADLAQALANAPVIEPTRDPRVILVFPGQGSLVPGLVRGLHDADAVFRDRLRDIADRLRRRAAIDVCELLLGRDGELLRDTANAHPAIFALSYSLAEWLDEARVPIAATIGHSIGEFVSATRAGVFSLDDALELVLARGRLIASLPPGGMMAVGLDAERVSALLQPELNGVDIACLNGPALTTLAGTVDDLRKARTRLAAQQIACVDLAVNRAFHSRMMRPVEDDWRKILATVTFRAARENFCSTVMGGWIDAEAVGTAGYWVSHLLGPVRFKDALLDAKNTVGVGNRTILIEAGAASGLTGQAEQWLGDERHHVNAIALLGLSKKAESASAPLEALGQLWCFGVPIAWPTLVDGSARRAVLPAREFERTRHFFEAPRRAAAPNQLSPQARPDLKRASYRTVDLEPAPRISQHQRRWLIVTASPESTHVLAEYLLDHGQIVTVVSPGPARKRVRRGVYQLSLQDHTAWIDFLRELRSLVRTPTIVIHATALNRQLSTQELLQSLSTLADAWAQEATSHLQIGVITPATRQILGNEDLDPRAAALAAASRVLEQEIPRVATRFIDLALPPADDPVPIDREIAALIGEALCGEPFGARSIRGARLFDREFEVLQVGATKPSPYRHGGVYLVTGGRGDLGQLIAADLARRFSATVVLASRQAAPPGDSDQLRERLESSQLDGGRVALAACDVTDVNAVRHLIADLRVVAGDLNGIFHAAGVADAEFLAASRVENREAVFAPKARGLEAIMASLQQVTPRPTLDFIVAFSSTATIVGGPAQGAYAAANAEMDAVMLNARATAATRAITVIWDTIRDTGMARRQTVASGSLLAEARDAYAIEPDDCPHLLEKALASGAREIIITRLDAAELSIAHRRIKEAFSSITERVARPDIATGYSAPSNELEKRLVDVWAQVLGVDRVGVHDRFTDLGGHSLVAARLKGEVKKAFDVDVPVSAVFAADTVAAMAGVIEKAILSELEPQAVPAVPAPPQPVE